MSQGNPGFCELKGVDVVDMRAFVRSVLRETLPSTLHTKFTMTFKSVVKSNRLAFENLILINYLFRLWNFAFQIAHFL